MNNPYLVAKDHTSHRPNGFDAYIQSRTVLKALSELSVGTFHMVTIEPDDVDALIADGVEWIVVDPANFSPGLEAKWAFAFSSFCTQIWGTPSTQAAGGYGWKITKLHQPVVVSDIAPVENGRTEEAPPPKPNSSSGMLHLSSQYTGFYFSVRNTILTQ